MLHKKNPASKTKSGPKSLLLNIPSLSMGQYGFNGRIGKNKSHVLLHPMTAFWVSS